MCRKNYTHILYDRLIIPHLLTLAYIFLPLYKYFYRKIFTKKANKNSRNHDVAGVSIRFRRPKAYNSFLRPGMSFSTRTTRYAARKTTTQ